ncbi:hypothetical protein SGPA1_50905 [Streptomyces misionensis JCM 4497]
MRTNAPPEPHHHAPPGRPPREPRPDAHPPRRWDFPEPGSGAHTPPGRRSPAPFVLGARSRRCRAGAVPGGAVRWEPGRPARNGTSTPSSGRRAPVPRPCPGGFRCESGPVRVTLGERPGARGARVRGAARRGGPERPGARQVAAHPVPEPRGEPPDGRFCHADIACRDEHHPPSHPRLHPAVPLPHRAPQGRDPDGDRAGGGRPLRPPGPAGHPRRGHRPPGGHRTAHVLPLLRHQGGGGRAAVRRRCPALGGGRAHRPGPPLRPAGPGTRRRAHPPARSGRLRGLLGVGAHPDPADRHQPRPAQGLGRGGPDLGGRAGGDPGATAGLPRVGRTGAGDGCRGGSGDR